MEECWDHDGGTRLRAAGVKERLLQLVDSNSSYQVEKDYEETIELSTSPNHSSLNSEEKIIIDDD